MRRLRTVLAAVTDLNGPTSAELLMLGPGYNKALLAGTLR
jgi:hypothetical protein